jgi:D-alanyl-D-alanine carboxypeptidase (penicillin-binding protein 5/6)
MLRFVALISVVAAVLTTCAGRGDTGQQASGPPFPRAESHSASTSNPSGPPSAAAAPSAPSTAAEGSAAEAAPSGPSADPALTPEPWAAAPTPTGASAPRVTATAVAVLDEASGTLLYGKDAQRPRPPASLTKVATAILALESGSLDDTVAIDVDSRKMKSSTVMGLLPGDEFSLRDLLYGLLLPSGNDAALAVGRHVGGSDAEFVEMMNVLAARLGLQHTHFANAHGLSARGHFSSAEDLALLARHAMSIPEFREIVGTTARVVRGSPTIELSNLNPFLHIYPNADGIKTGYTWRSGRTMLASATRDGHRVYVVLLNAPEMEKDAQALMDWAFASFRWSA